MISIDNTSLKSYCNTKMIYILDQNLDKII